jgi:hypothetical protein
MKKITAFLAVLMIVGFTGVVFAASLAWNTATMPVGSTITLDNSPTISASFGFGASLVNAIFSHTYNFTSSSNASVLAQLIELPTEDIDIFSMTFDGVAMTFDSVNQRWFGFGANTFNHAILLNGTTHLEGSAYLVTASSVNNVPIPAAIWLFGSAIAGLMGISTRKTLAKSLVA